MPVFAYHMSNANGSSGPVPVPLQMERGAP